MNPFTDFYPLIQPFAKGVPAAALNNGIRQAAIEFCERTRMWKYRDTFQVNASDEELLFAPSGAQVIAVESARFNGRHVEPVTEQRLDELRPTWRTDDTAASTEANYITQREWGSILLYPRATGTLDLTMWLKPAPDAAMMPDFLLQFREVIANGALGYVLMMPQQPFTDPDRAQFYAMKFDNKLGTLSYQSTRGQQRAKVRSKAQFF